MNAYRLPKNNARLRGSEAPRLRGSEAPRLVRLARLASMTQGRLNNPRNTKSPTTPDPVRRSPRRREREKTAAPDSRRLLKCFLHETEVSF